MSQRAWSVGCGLIRSRTGELLMVQNQRRNGSVDFSPPGGVIDDGEDVVGGLTREVAEETGLRVAAWSSICYQIEVCAPDLGWTLEVTARQANDFEGEVTVADPDGIVTEAEFMSPERCREVLGSSPRWVAEPVLDWLNGEHETLYRYEVNGLLPDLQVRRR